MVTLSREALPVALTAFVAVAFGTLTLFLLWESASEWRRKRQVRARLADEERRLRAVDANRGGILKGRSEEKADTLERLAARLPHMDRITVLLEQARITWTPGMFVLLTLGCAGAAGLLGGMIQGGLAGLLLAGVFGGSLPTLWALRRRTVRFRRFEEEFPGAVDLLARATRAGHPFSSGLGMVGREGPKVVAEEFQRLSEEHRYGMPLDDALAGLEERVDLMDVRIFTTAVVIQKEVGGNLAEILDNIGQTIRARFTIRRQLRVYTAQGRLSGYVLGLLPLFVTGALFLLDPTYASMLWEHWLGRALVMVAAVMQVIGYLWIRHIVNIEI